MGAQTHFGLEIRAALCDYCGAPIQCTIAGDQVRCKFCRTVNIIRRRTPPPERAPERTRMSEEERLRQLRLQDHRPLAVPPRLAGWLRGGQLEPRFRDDVLQEWLAARTLLLERPHDRAQSDYVFLLAMYLASVLDPHHTRALLENTVDILPTEVDRNVIRCMLAHQAALEGELDAAEAWLGRAAPRPRLLLQDTAYRLASSTIAFCRRRPGDVLEILGAREGQIPIFDGFDDEAELYRCHALELRGEVQAATDRLWHRTRNPASLRPLAVLVERDPRLPLCPQSWPVVEEKQWHEIDEALRKRIHVPSAAWIMVGVVGLLLPAPGLAMGGGLLAGNGEALLRVILLALIIALVALLLGRARRRSKRIADRARRAFARVISTSFFPDYEARRYAPSTRSGTCHAVVDVVLDDVHYELRFSSTRGFAYVGYELPCIFDPESGRIEVEVPPVDAPRLAPPLPFG